MTIYRFSALFFVVALVGCQQAPGDSEDRIAALEARIAQLEQAQAASDTLTAATVPAATQTVSSSFDAMADLRARSEASQLAAEQANIRSEIADMKRDQAFKELLEQ